MENLRREIHTGGKSLRVDGERNAAQHQVFGVQTQFVCFHYDKTEKKQKERIKSRKDK